MASRHLNYISNENGYPFCQVLGFWGHLLLAEDSNFDLYDRHVPKVPNLWLLQE